MAKSKKPTEGAKKRRPRKLDPLREQLAVLTNEANERVFQLMEKGYDDVDSDKVIAALEKAKTEI